MCTLRSLSLCATLATALLFGGTASSGEASDEMLKLKVENARLRADNAALKAEIAKLKFRLAERKPQQGSVDANLKKIGAALAAYAKDHKGEFPPKLIALVPKYLPDRSALRNPRVPSVNRAKDGVDFIYIGVLRRTDEGIYVVAVEKDKDKEGKVWSLAVGGKVKLASVEVAMTTMTMQFTALKENKRKIIAHIPGKGAFDPTDRLLPKLRAFEGAAIGSCRVYCSAQTMYKRNDWDKNKELEYTPNFTRLYSEKDKGEPIELINKAFAAATATGTPKHGYRFAEMKTIGKEPIDWVNDYALCATPAEYGKTGKRTFIVCTNGTVFGKDLGASKFVKKYPADPSAEGWDIAE